ncbi:MAG: GNAT family N-acetyltransferase [Chloroflexi bacterium]|nr:GNAT family N-acetyltransferase [Chloroflexota bacterium]
MTTTLRSITEQDMDFLCRVYASTREAELAVLDWDDARKESFLQMQFTAQHTHYQHHFGDASFDLVLIDDEPVGRLYLHHRKDEIRIIDIALLTQHRGKGVGSALMRGILDQAAQADLSVRIHVERNNPALGLSHRLGFCEIGDEGAYWLMEWKPEKPGPPALVVHCTQRIGSVGTRVDRGHRGRGSAKRSPVPAGVLCRVRWASPAHLAPANLPRRARRNGRA